MNAQLITVIIQIIILVVGALIIKILPDTNADIYSKTALISEWAYKFVINAKNILSSSTGEEKKAQVFAQLQSFAEKNGISLTDNELSALIEDAYDRICEKINNKEM